MNALLTRAHVAGLRLGSALRRHWRRIALGVACGWLLSTVLGAFALVWLETRDVISPHETAPLLGGAMVWSGMVLGGLVAYAARPERAGHRQRSRRR